LLNKMESVIHPLIVCIRLLCQHKLTCGIEAGCSADFEAGGSVSEADLGGAAAAAGDAVEPGT
jgi:hypothetical protein